MSWNGPNPTFGNRKTEPFGAENDPEKPDPTGSKAFSEWHWNGKAFLYLGKNGYYDPLNRLL